METDKQLVQKGFASLGKTFRGEIWDNCKRFRLVGKAYEAMPREQNGHFVIESARHLAGPLMALRDPGVRVVVVIGATQVLKSIIGDIWTPFVIEHEPRNMLVLFEDDPKAKLFCDARLMDTIYQHPIISGRVADVDRHDATKTVIKLPNMLLKVCGLNDGNVSSLSWPLMWISESWQHGRDGLLRKAIKRADRFPSDCKILIESQAGLVGEDLHTEASSAHQVPLTWACPYCGGRQTWDFTQTRPETFTPLPRFDGTGTPPKPGTYAGMTFDGEPLTIDERARTAVWQCYHCGTGIKDTREIRQQIMDSYQQDYKINGVSPRAVCFTLPKESARDNSFEESAKSYLKAKLSEKAGNMLPIQDWYMQERAIFYGPKLTQVQVSVITGNYDPTNTMPDERARLMMVDSQMDPETKKIGHFWYVAWSVDKFGNITQLARGYATSWQEWIAIQKGLKIPNKNVGIDGGHWLHEIVEIAAANWELVVETIGRKKISVRSTWKILVGHGTKRSFRWDDKQWRVVAPPSYHSCRVEIKKGEFVSLQVPVYYWSNLSVKDQLFTLRAGGNGKPKMVALRREQLTAATQAKEVGDLAYDKQVSVEYRTQKNGKDIWLEGKENVNHYNDCECEGIVLCGLGGLLGHTTAPDESATEV